MGRFSSGERWRNGMGDASFFLSSVFRRRLAPYHLLEKKRCWGWREARDLKEGTRSKSKLIGVTRMEVRQISFSVDSNKSPRSKGFRNIEVNL